METTSPMERGTLLSKGSLPVFLAVAFGGAWLAAVPLWLSGGGTKSPILGVTALGMMFTPTVAVLVTWLVARRHRVGFRDLLRETGLGFGPRKRRTFATIGALWIGVPLYVAVTVLLCAALGLYELDLTGLSLFNESLDDLPGGSMPSDMSPELFAVVSLALVPLNPLLNAIPCLGEELGWRGFLMPRLLRYGQFRAILASGVIWGLWHAPLTLLGYNYANLGAWAALMFVPFCVLFGAVLSWTRLVTGSVWPSVVGHGALNGSTVLMILAGAAGQEPNFVLVGPISVVGLVVLAVVVAALFVRGRNRADGTVGFQTGSAALGGR